MKNKMKINLFFALAAVALAACNNDFNEPVNTGVEDGLATIRFETSTSGLNARSLNRNAIVPSYTVDDLRILAFRQDEADNAFKYIGDVKKDEIVLNGSTFSGNAQLPVGTYKFIPLYGVNAEVGMSVLDKAVEYSDNLTLTHDPAKVLPAIFLQHPDVVEKVYTLGVDSKTSNEIVKMALKRAVARLDVQFVRASKVDEVYKEEGGDLVLGGAQLAAMNVTLNGITSNVNMTKGAVNTESVDHTYAIPVASALTMGNADATKFGGEGYDYDAVDEGDFIRGSVHVQGPYVFPFADDTKSTTLSIEVTSGKDATTGQVYHRTIAINGVKLLRNQVTLVKIYVPGDDLFHTNVGFEVTIQKAWDAVIDDSWGAAE